MCCECGAKNSFGDPRIDVSLLRPVVEKFRDAEGSLITVLQAAQELYGYLPVGLLKWIADEMKIKPADVMGVATFYTQFRLAPVGKNLILLCQGTACHVNGSKKIEEALSDELGVGEGETTPDGLFTYNNVACLGCCSLSPVMMINGETYGALTPDKTRKIIISLRKREESISMQIQSKEQNSGEYADDGIMSTQIQSAKRSEPQ